MRIYRCCHACVPFEVACRIFGNASYDSSRGIDHSTLCTSDTIISGNLGPNYVASDAIDMLSRALGARHLNGNAESDSSDEVFVIFEHLRSVTRELHCTYSSTHLLTVAEAQRIKVEAHELVRARQGMM